MQEFTLLRVSLLREFTVFGIHRVQNVFTKAVIFLWALPDFWPKLFLSKPVSQWQPCPRAWATTNCGSEAGEGWLLAWQNSSQTRLRSGWPRCDSGGRASAATAGFRVSLVLLVGRRFRTVHCGFVAAEAVVKPFQCGIQLGICRHAVEIDLICQNPQEKLVILLTLSNSNKRRWLRSCTCRSFARADIRMRMSSVQEISKLKKFRLLEYRTKRC